MYTTQKVALFSTSEYSFDTHSTSSWWSLIDLKSGKVSQLTNDSNVSEITWLGSSDTGLLYINGTNADTPGGVELWVADASNFAQYEALFCFHSVNEILLIEFSRYKAASLPASFSGLKTAVTKSGDINFLVYGQAYGNGTAYNEEAAATPLSSARIYDSIYARHWDTWLTTISNAVFSGTLKKSSKSTSGSAYALDGPLKNLLAGVKGIESPYPPFGGSSDYDISPNGKWVAFKSKAPELPRANHTASYIYLVPHDGSKKAKAINGPDSPGTPEGVKGDSSSPVFSPNSKKIAYVQQADISYESDRRTLYVYTVGSEKTIDTLAKDWDRSPDAVKWNAKGDEIILGTEDRGRERLFSVPIDAGDDYKPKNFTDGGVVSGYYTLPNGEYLVTASAIWTSWQVYTASPKKGVIKTLFSANKVDPGLKGLGPADVGEFYFKGNWTDVRIILDDMEYTSANSL